MITPISPVEPTKGTDQELRTPACFPSAAQPCPSRALVNVLVDDDAPGGRGDPHWPALVADWHRGHGFKEGGREPDRRHTTQSPVIQEMDAELVGPDGSGKSRNDQWQAGVRFRRGQLVDQVLQPRQLVPGRNLRFVAGHDGDDVVGWLSEGTRSAATRPRRRTRILSARLNTCSTS